MSYSFYELIMRASLVSGRGTTVQRIDVHSPNWAGEPDREYLQEKMKGVSANETVTICRGTACVKVENYPKSRPSKIYSTNGCIIVINRGTSSRIL